MQRVDQNISVCRIFTFKEGLLSGLGHDLRINVTSFVIDLGAEGHFISARFDAGSLKVDCAMVSGVERPDLLSPRDRNDINDKIREVLNVEVCPEIVLVSSSVKKDNGGYVIRGGLTLCNRTRDISFAVKKTNGSKYDVDFSMHLPDFGIKPVSTLFGAIRIKPDLLIHLEIPSAYVPEIDLTQEMT